MLYTQNPPKRQFGLDLIRVIAIGLVLLSHFAKTVDYLGFWGVELFFGLSGYLIGHILWRSFSTAESWSGAQIINFWSRRWWRTLPSYYLFFFVSLLLAYTFSQPVPSATELSKFIWFGQSFARHGGWFYGVSWSLCIEEWFYLIFPILLLVLTLCGFKAKYAFSLSILVMFISCFIARQLLIREGVGEDLRLITIGRLDAIASGVFVTFYTSFFSLSNKQKRVLFAVGTVLMIASIIIPNALQMSFGMIKGNAYLLLSAPLGGALTLPFVSTLKRPQGIFTFLSDGIEKVSLWSYSIYLSHMPILSTIYTIQDRFGLADFRNSTFGNILTKAVGLLLILSISAFLHNYFETPFTRRRPVELQPLHKQSSVHS